MEALREKFAEVRTILSILSMFIFVINLAYTNYLLRYRKHMSLSDFFGSKFFARPATIILMEIVFVAGILSTDTVYSNFENTNIGSFFEKEQYEESYYVYIRTDKKLQKSYRVKADIIKGSYGYFDYNDEGKEIYVELGNGYFLKKIHWDNGGYITFLHEDDYPTCTYRARLYPGKETYVYDEYDEEYFVTLTTEKAERN